MSTLLNKSNHPVHVKKIPITVWSLREEIEAAIKVKIEANSGNTEDLDISDIQKFYSELKTYDDLPNEAEDGEDHEDDDLDPSGNPMDDDAKAMMEAMGGGEDDEKDAEKSEEDDAEKSDEDDAEKSDEDDAAAALAAEMMAGQGGDSAASEGEKTPEELAAEMLGDQGADSNQTTTEQAGFKRVFPDKKSRDFGFIFLSDINMEQALIFTRKKYMTGSNIIIELNIPKKFTLTAEVLTTFAVNMNSRVISETKPNYRIQCKLHFSFEGERTNLRDFLKSIEPDVPPPPSKLKKPVTAEEDEDEFDDLGF